ncbi:MAG: twin-arginine translocase TatA/TatE family subunit [Ignavibacteriae bacterium]|nr:twin-arginine translocase TatA/TatE family subunit [Ignavibacteriota bacterium]
MFGNLSTTEILLIAAGIFLLFGAKKIPEFVPMGWIPTKGIGQGIRSFKHEVQGDNKSAKEL